MKWEREKKKNQPRHRSIVRQNQTKERTYCISSVFSLVIIITMFISHFVCGVCERASKKSTRRITYRTFFSRSSYRTYLFALPICLARAHLNTKTHTHTHITHQAERLCRMCNAIYISLRFPFSTLLRLTTRLSKKVNPNVNRERQRREEKKEKKIKLRAI